MTHDKNGATGDIGFEIDKGSATLETKLKENVDLDGQEQNSSFQNEE